MSEMVMVNVTPQAKKLVEHFDRLYGSAVTQKRAVEVMLSVYEGPEGEARFAAALARLELVEARTALAKAEAKSTSLAEAETKATLAAEAKSKAAAAPIQG